MNKEKIEMIRLEGDAGTSRQDFVAAEMVFYVKVYGKQGYCLRCTPENLEELVLGSLFTRGCVQKADQVERLEISFLDGEIQVTVKEAQDSDKNKEMFVQPYQPAQEPHWEVRKMLDLAQEIFDKPGELFDATGCAHSCTLVLEERVVCSFEDIGRHNALDKVIGFALKQQIPLEQCTVYTSGRISGDYLEKIIRGGIPMVVSRAAVTSEAVKLAKKHGIVMVGFARNHTGNLYGSPGNQS